MPKNSSQKYAGSDASTDRSPSPPPLTPADFGISNRPAARGSSTEGRGKCIKYTVGIAVVAVIGAVGMAIAISPNGLENPFEPIDPPGQTEANPWRSGSTGLDLVVENALENRYDAMFDEYISKWNESPSLNLRSIKVEYDYECSETMGRVKVCNGDYGRTDWKGLALNFMRNGNTIWSTSRLNDFFLDSGSVSDKKYTMCHEQGHSYGLPHLDENYWNFDSGDCMDYTLRPRNNLEPGNFSLEFLAEMYGSSSSSSSSSSTTGRGGYLRHKKQRALNEDEGSLQQDGIGTIPNDIMLKYREAVVDIETSKCAPGVCNIVLGGGFEIHAHKLGV
uniref:Peptidase M10 metallopeptidase domain-containing protein n=1 Tax=Grammatophora oceanica TaxID=210454 RepID=A0A7S1Y133_9STRA